jgi:hypothetical protein
MHGNRVLIVVSALLAFAIPGFAQSPAGKAFSSSYHPYEIAATYTHVLTDNTYVGTETLNGWTASFSAPVLPLLKATAQIGDYHGRVASMKSFLGGVQAGFHIYRFQPFIRVLAGISHAPGATPFTMAGGGGVNMAITDHIDLRLLDMDYYRLHGGGAPDGADYLRIGFGIAYEFGSR